MALTVNVYKSIDSIERQALEAISGDDPFFSYEWFKILETQKAVPNVPIYMAVYDSNKLVALAPCFMDWSDNYFYAAPKLRFFTPILQKVLTVGHKFGFCQKHMLLCYSPSCGRTKIIQKQGEQNQKAISDAIVKRIDSLCKRDRYLFSSFPFVSKFDTHLTGSLSNSRYYKSQGTTNFYLDVRWQTFDDYLLSLKSNFRRNLHKKMRKCQESGVTIEIQDFSSFSYEELSNQLHNLMLKYNRHAVKTILPSYFEIINRYAGSKISLFVAKKNETVVGFSLFFKQGSMADAWMCGFNYDAMSDANYTYFSLVYYEPIKWAIKEGVKKINFRSSSERAKLDCGCQREETSVYLKCHDSVFGSTVNFVLNSPFWSSFCRHLEAKKT